MLFWGVIGIIAFIVIVRLIKAVISNNESSDDKAIVSAEMQKEIAEALREKYAAIELISNDTETLDGSGKKERTITFKVNQIDDIENATDAVLRDLLRWFNLEGLDCGKAVISPVVPAEFADRVTASFNRKIRAHKRVQEMERMGCSISFETTDPNVSGDDNSE